MPNTTERLPDRAEQIAEHAAEQQKYRVKSSKAGGSAAVADKKPEKASKKGSKKPVKEKKQKRSGDTFSKIIAFLIVLLLIYAFLSLIIVGVIYYSFNSTSKSGDLYSIKVLNDNKTLYSLTTSKANNEYGLYLPFSYLQSIADLGIAGIDDDVTIYIIGTENRINCPLNSSLVFINDNPVRIAAPVIYSAENEDYLIPVSLLEQYINGIDVVYDNEKMVCNISSSSSKADISLKLLLPEPMEKAHFTDEQKIYGTLPSEESE